MSVTLLSYSLTTLAKVKLYLGITDTSQDDLLNTLINETTEFIQNYCGGRNFLSQSYTEIKDSHKGRTKIFLNQYPVTAFTTLEYRSGTPSSPSWVTYNADSYLTYLSEGYIQFYGTLPEVPQGLRATYTAGYLIDFTHEANSTYHTLPFELTKVCTELVGKAYNTKDSVGITSESTEGQSVTFSSKGRELDSDHKVILSQYTAIRYAI